MSDYRKKKSDETYYQYGQRIGHYLLGTCDIAPDELYDSIEAAEGLDSIALYCDYCGWWISPDEVVENDASAVMCSDCLAEI